MQMNTSDKDTRQQGHIIIDHELCKGCQLCISFCPRNAISPSDQVNASGYFPVIAGQDGDCTGCAICAVVCPEAAIEVYRG